MPAHNLYLHLRGSVGLLIPAVIPRRQKLKRNITAKQCQAQKQLQTRYYKAKNNNVYYKPAQKARSVENQISSHERLITLGSFITDSKHGTASE